MTRTNIYRSPLGDIVLTSDDGYLVCLDFADKHAEVVADADSDAVLAQARRWLDEYFSGHEPATPLPPMNLDGTPFQHLVWSLLLNLPYGTTTTYGALAQQIAEAHGIERMSARAVGQAVGHNPISLMIPCHRVIAASGKLGGYGGGLVRKQALLDMEHRVASAH